MDGTAVVLTNGQLGTLYGKTGHGLIRESERYKTIAVVDHDYGGRDAGEVMDGRPRGIPVFTNLDEVLAHGLKPDYCVIGCATHGGVLPANLRGVLEQAIRAGMSIVSGMHEFLADDEELAALAMEHGVALIDVRKPKRKLHFFEGRIFSIRVPRIAVLGTDCAIGKRTTARFLLNACRHHGMKAQMVTTGQTGWMQGSPHGFILDSIANDFVCGELEHAIVATAEEYSPDVIFLEGQSALRNPSGPCGSEFILSGGARGVILQHAPGRKFFEGYAAFGCRIPPVEEEVELIRMLGARVLAVTLSGQEIAPEALVEEQTRLRGCLGLPVVRPLDEGVESLVSVIQEHIRRETQ
jgi:uncharacterized NAD-dependent epimerase/dehydratase family protein